MKQCTRRRALAAGGAVAMGAIAGCTSSADEDEPEDEESDPEGTVLGDIEVENLSTNAHEVDVLVDFDGELEHWSSHDLDGGDGNVLDRDWTSDPSEFRVRARLDGENLTEVTQETWNDPDCLSLVIVVDRDGEIDILGSPTRGRCGEDADEEPDPDGFD